VQTNSSSFWVHSTHLRTSNLLFCFLMICLISFFIEGVFFPLLKLWIVILFLEFCAFERKEEKTKGDRRFHWRNSANGRTSNSSQKETKNQNKNETKNRNSDYCFGTKRSEFCHPFVCVFSVFSVYVCVCVCVCVWSQHKKVISRSQLTKKMNVFNSVVKS
jgi:hypothetical protein